MEKLLSALAVHTGKVSSIVNKVCIKGYAPGIKYLLNIIYSIPGMRFHRMLLSQWQLSEVYHPQVVRLTESPISVSIRQSRLRVSAGSIALKIL